VEVEHEFGEGKVGYLYLIDGLLSVIEQTMSKGDAAKILGPGGVRVKAEKMSEVVLVEAPE
jgi:redox-sensitive bicupin YhaK (pirin superfamily)